MFGMSSPKFFRSSELQGKTVIDTTGNRLGKVKEVGLGADGSAMFFLEKDDGSETAISASNMMAIGEFMVMRAETAQGQTTVPPTPEPAPAVAPAPSTPQTVCRNCGAAMKPGSRFCTKCGTRAF